MSVERADRMIAVAIASAGYAVSAPDDLGLGLGPDRCPYDHVPSTVTASVDALCVTRAVDVQEQRHLDDRVLVSGFSQGGPAIMTLGQPCRSTMDGAFRPGALAQISGPYVFTGSLQSGLCGDIASTR